MRILTTAQLRTALEVLKKLEQRIDNHATHTTMQVPDARLGEDYSARIESQTIEQIARVKTVMAQSDNAKAFANPKVPPGKVKWHSDLAAASTAAKKSGKPVLLFHMMGKLDDLFC